uniref:ARRDC2 protein n=1 Tax=Fopius arisanus TaxID=64838 RepID=A0A0C9QG07_9HYME
MPSDKSIAIRVNKFPIVYSPGETITGEAVVDLDEAATCRGISLRFKGRSKVHWSETRGTGKNRRTVYYRAEENYFGTEVYVVGSSHGEIELVGGQHIFPFTFTLPMNIPNSFEHKYGDVVYNIKAVMDIAWALDPECYLPFTVYSPLDITQIPSHIIEDEVHAEYCCCILPCLGQGFMEARIHIPKSTYEVGDELDVIIEIIASSRSVDIQAIRLRLKQVNH